MVLLAPAIAGMSRADTIAVELLRHVARIYPEVDAVTIRKALELAAAEIRARIKANARVQHRQAGPNSDPPQT